MPFLRWMCPCNLIYIVAILVVLGTTSRAMFIYI
nr:MAG TPA: transmembrane protein [Crassvirales sp.]